MPSLCREGMEYNSEPAAMTFYLFSAASNGECWGKELLENTDKCFPGYA